MRLFTALRIAAVAAAAGVASGTWADTTVPRVFRGLAGFLGGRNRGRLPFVEFDIVGQGYEQESFDGGTMTQTVTVRVHLGSRDPEVASALANSILASCLAAIRSEGTDNLTAIGGDQINGMQPSPWGIQRDAVLTIEQSFGRASYEVT